MESSELGLYGEERAVELLSSKGYRIRHRNWRYGHREIDIVAEDEEYVIIVEVKTRREGGLVPAVESVDKMKMRNLIYAANAYAKRFGIVKGLRFDIIAISVDYSGRSKNIVHIEDAFIPAVNMI